MHGQVWDPKKDGDGLGECLLVSLFDLHIVAAALYQGARPAPCPCSVCISNASPLTPFPFSLPHCVLCIVSCPAGGAGKTGVEKMMESMESGDSGGLPMVRPGDASKFLCLWV